MNALTTALQAPVQGRSKASYERMVAAAEELMVSRGSDDFTLIEVSKQGKVSIGSIYNRFESKDALLHAAQYRSSNNSIPRCMNGSKRPARTPPT